MKKAILSSLVAATMLWSCGYSITSDQEMEAKQKTIDSLNNVSAMKDSSMTMLAMTMSSIQNNLNYIKEKEEILSVGVDGKENGKSQIESDIKAIYARLVENKDKVKALQAQLNKAVGKNKEYDKIVSVLKAQIEQQNKEIERLTSLLNEKDVEIGFLNDAVVRLSSSVDSLANANNQTNQQLAAQTAEMQKGYYIVADKSKLKQIGLLEGGLFTKKVLSGETVDNSLFTEINTTEVSEIPLSGRRFQVLTSHPQSSYTIDEDAKKLIIKDKTKFWNNSKYLIVRAKGANED